MNKIILLGRLTKAPEMRFSQNNQTKVALFTLAVNRKYVAKGEERQADFINIVAWSKLADFAEKYLKQGIQVCVSGRLQIRRYEDNNGQTRYATEVIAEEIDFADSFKKEKADESILCSNTTVDNKNENEDVSFENADDLPF